VDLDQIEELIRRYLAAGVAVVVILAGPVTGTDIDPGARPGVVDRTDERGEIRDGTPGADGSTDPTGDAPPDGTGDPTEPTGDAAGGEGGSEDAVGGDAIGGGDSGAAGDEPAGSDATGDDAAAGDETADDGTTGGSPAGGGTADDGADEHGADEDTAGGDTVGGDAAGGAAGSDATDEDATDEDATDEDATDEDATDEDAADEDAADEDAADEDAADEDAAADGGPTGTGSADAGDVGADGSADADRDRSGRTDADAAGPDPDPTGTAAPAPVTRSPDGAAAGEVVTAAERFGWGRPERVDEFRSADLAGWEPYTGPGYRGRGQRSPDALAVDDGVLTISGDARGTTGGLCWSGGQRYGRWEARVRAPEADPAYHALLLLWPDADDFPTGGQVAFLELTDPARRSAEFYLHHGGEGDRVRSEVRVDATRWRTWAVDWAPGGITGYVDGEEWFSSTDPATLPPGPMHLCVQLDFFPVQDGRVRPSRMEVDWVRRYAPATPTGPPPGGGGPVRLPN
jgi:hypothetical protein